MRKLQGLIVTVLVSVCFLFGIPSAGVQAASLHEVYLGGMPAGFLLSVDGAQIVGLCNVATSTGSESPAADAGLKVGDTIVGLDGHRVDSIADVERALTKAGESVTVEYRRGGAEESVVAHPAKECASGKNKLGVLIRDTVSGIGTVTCIDAETRTFGALGHPVFAENNQKMSIGKGGVYRCSVVGVTKGVRGRAGELKGLFLDAEMATATSNTDTGIFGTVHDSFDCSALTRTTIAPLSEAKMGKAEILTTVNGLEPRHYEIAIVKVDKGNRENKNFVIKITDESLLSETGGIVQGMSGSPIVQNGKLIGAVTHVFLNDPTRGYGIGIETMFGE